MQTIGVIPAKGLSIELPRKNLLDLGGKPLLVWTLETAIKAFDRVVVSTDDAEISDLCKKYKVEIVSQKPSTATNVVIDTIETIKAQDWDKVFLLQPTSPFRTLESLQKAIKILDKDFAVVGITPICKSNTLRDFIKTRMVNPLDLGGVNKEKQRQDVTTLFRISGSIFGSRVLDLKASKSFLADHAIPMVVSYKESLEIDTKYDLELCRYMVNF